MKCKLCEAPAHYMDRGRELIACQEHIILFGEPYPECYDCHSNIEGLVFHYEKHVFCQKCYKDRTKAEFDAEDDPGTLEWC